MPVRHPAWVQGAVPLELFEQVTKILGNPFPFVPRYMDISCLFWEGLELNQGDEAVGCSSWWAVSYSHPTELRSGMSVTAIIGTWARGKKACFLFADNYWLCVFKKRSRLCCALSGWASRLRLIAKSVWLALAQYGGHLDLPSPPPMLMWDLSKTDCGEWKKQGC